MSESQVAYLLSIIGDKEVLIYQLRQQLAEVSEQLDKLKKDHAEETSAPSPAPVSFPQRG